MLVLCAGHTGIGHGLYATAGSSSAQEAQPFFVNSPLGIYLIHNGNVTNTQSLRYSLEGSQSFFNRHLRTDSDSEVQLHAHSLSDDPRIKLLLSLSAANGSLPVCMAYQESRAALQALLSMFADEVLRANQWCSLEAGKSLMRRPAVPC